MFHYCKIIKPDENNTVVDEKAGKVYEQTPKRG